MMKMRAGAVQANIQVSPADRGCVRCLTGSKGVQCSSTKGVHTMFNLLFYMVLGLALLFVVPSVIPPRSSFENIAIRAGGLAAIAFGVFSTSYVYVPDHH